nr:glycoside hydrolase family 88 protein [uncultured Sphaerochaeta sp.]
MKNITQGLLEKNITLVVDRLLLLGGGNYEKDRDTQTDTQFTGQVERDFGIEEWDWPQGVGLLGLSKLQKVNREEKYDAFLAEWYRKNFEIGLPSRNVNTTAPFLVLLDYATRTGNKAYLEECKHQAYWIMENLPRTKENGFQHVTSAIGGDRQAVRLNENQLWIDTIFMAVLFLYSYGQRFDDTSCIEEAIQQVLVHIKYLYEKENGLFYHGWSFNRNDNFGKIFWCRGNSWFTLGITEFLAMDTKHPLPESIRKFLIDTYRAQVKSLSQLQRKSGLWSTVLTDSSSYEEVSGSAGIAAGIYRGLNLGLLDDSYRCVADYAIAAICENVSDDGIVKNVSAGTAIGMDSDFYKRILIRPMAYGQSLTLMALIEALDELKK